jgi:hypothetical protein
MHSDIYYFLCYIAHDHKSDIIQKILSNIYQMVLKLDYIMYKSLD